MNLFQRPFSFFNCDFRELPAVGCYNDFKQMLILPYKLIQVVLIKDSLLRVNPVFRLRFIHIYNNEKGFPSELGFLQLVAYKCSTI